MLLLILLLLPWLPPMRRAAPALVTLDQCNGCTRCQADCPYAAITMVPRTDGLKFDLQAEVNPDKCVSCGICAGACPTATPFRRRADLVAGIDLPDSSIADLRDRIHAAADLLGGKTRILVMSCQHAARTDDLVGPEATAVKVPCIGAIPPSFIDYMLSEGLADGVMLSGCSEGECYNRFGGHWTKARLEGTRDPNLRKRVPRERIGTFWGNKMQGGGLRREIERFAGSLADLPKPPLPDRSGPPPAPSRSKEASDA